MDINLLFKNAEMACGRVLKILPKDEIGSPKQYLQEILETRTLPSLNEVYPYIKRIELDVTGLTQLHGSDPLYVGYRIPAELTSGLEIYSIKSCYSGTGGTATSSQTMVDGSGVGRLGRGLRLAAYPNKYGRYSSANLYETVLMGQLAYTDNMLLGQYQEAIVVRFEAPNIMWVNKAYACTPVFTLTLCLENDKNLLSIPNNVFDAVRRLFILDVKSTIYNQYGMLSSIDTALGTIDLKIEDWSGAESERNDLFDTHKSFAHLRTHSIKNG